MTVDTGPADAPFGPGGPPVGVDDATTDEPALRPEACVYAGERVRTAAELGAGWAALTTHRLLVYDPAAAGKRYVTVDRPNVADVDVGTTGGERQLAYAPQLLFYGVASLVVAFIVRAIDFGSSTQVQESQLPGMESLVSMFDLLLTGLAVLETGLFIAAFAFILAGIGAFGLYWTVREPALVVRRAGDDTLRLPAPHHVAREAASSLRVQLDIQPSQGGVRRTLADAVDWPSADN